MRSCNLPLCLGDVETGGAFSFKAIAMVSMRVGTGFGLAGIESLFMGFHVILRVVCQPEAALLIRAGMFARLRADMGPFEWKRVEIAVCCLCGPDVAASQYVSLEPTSFSPSTAFSSPRWR